MKLVGEASASRSLKTILILVTYRDAWFGREAAGRGGPGRTLTQPHHLHPQARGAPGPPHHQGTTLQ